MSTTATIQYLRLDADGDPIFDPGSVLTDIDAVTQAINTRILLFLGEWWEDTSQGTPMFQSILGGAATTANLQAMQLALVQRISGAPYVSSVESLALNFTSATRAFSVSYSALTAFGSTGTINLSIPAPSTASSIGG